MFRGVPCGSPNWIGAPLLPVARSMGTTSLGALPFQRSLTTCAVLPLGVMATPVSSDPGM
jgi:hypothetical protein